MHNLNEQLFLFINGAAGESAFLDSFFLSVTNIFVPVFIIFAVVWFFVVLPKRSKTPFESVVSYKNAGLLLVSLIIVWPIVEFIKGSVAFPRPTQILENVYSLIAYSGYDSFPSLHTAFAFTIAAFIYRYSKSTGIMLFTLASLVGISRVFVGVHFPLDVAVGAFIGIMVPWGIISVFKRYGV